LCKEGTGNGEGPTAAPEGAEGSLRTEAAGRREKASGDCRGLSEDRRNAANAGFGGGCKSAPKDQAEAVGKERTGGGGATGAGGSANLWKGGIADGKKAPRAGPGANALPTDCTCCAHRTPDGVCARTVATLPAGVHTPKVQEGRLSDVGGALPADGHVVACSKKKDKVARGGAFAMGREKNNKKNKKTRKKQPLKKIRVG